LLSRDLPRTPPPPTPSPFPSPELLKKRHVPWWTVWLAYCRRDCGCRICSWYSFKP
jgi:hypothetical protein